MKIIQEISEMDLRNHFLVAVAEVYREERYLVYYTATQYTPSIYSCVHSSAFYFLKRNTP
jgi:hypothetical protein